MCGISGVISLSGQPIPHIGSSLRTMMELTAHRGPDGEGFWISADESVGLSHSRLSIIDISSSGDQPMVGLNNDVLVFNGEIYNYREIRQKAKAANRKFKSSSDTEAILAAYEHDPIGFIHQLRGMFAFAIWNSNKHEMILARDRFGIKPLYYLQDGELFYFASEAKALVPFVQKIETQTSVLAEYLTFQNTLGSKTMFSGISKLMPGQLLRIGNQQIQSDMFWDISYDIDFDSSEDYFVEKLRGMVNESIELHLESDVEVGAYLSGGVDSSLIAGLARRVTGSSLKAFHGRYTEFSGYDESKYAVIAAEHAGLDLSIQDLNSTNVIDYLRKVIYHLDYPVAGPGALPQFMTSQLASHHVKVVLGGQGGDEIFGGYARYMIGYLEQCLRAAIDGTSKNGNFVVTLESIIPNLGLLREYQPLLQKFWKQGLFGELDERYFQLVERASDLGNAINWEVFDRAETMNSYLAIFNSSKNVKKEAYFDSMTHFDFKTLLPALLHVEDRMSMAHGIESRVPFLDHPLVEFAATIPADVKFKNGELKRLLKVAFPGTLPSAILNRRDKMGFPVPLAEWARGSLKKDFDGLLESLRDRDLDFINDIHLTDILNTSPKFSRGIWALISLEIWFQEFHDSADRFRATYLNRS